MSYKDLSGEKFGRWTIIDEAEPKYIKGNRRIRYWNCVCECGTKRAVLERSLENGTSKSCGCYHSEIMHDVGKVNATHNMSDSRLYRIYKHMHNRCYTYNGETHTIAEWAKIINMPYKKLWKRFCSGWSPERALTT